MSIPTDKKIDEMLDVKNNIKNTDTDFIEKTDGPISNSVESNIIPEETSNNVSDLNAKIEDENQNEEVLLASIFPKKIPKPKKKETLTEKPYGENQKEIYDKQQEAITTKVPEDKPYVFEEGTGNVIFREWEDTEIEFIGKTMENLQMGKLDFTKDKVIFKPNYMEKGMKITDFQDVVYNIFKDNIDLAKRGKMKIEDIANEAAKIGRNDIYLKILKRKPGDTFNVEETYRAILEVSYAKMETDRLAKVLQTGNATQKQIQNFYQALQLYGGLFSQVAGSVSETGRALGVISKMDTPSLEGVLDLETIMKQMGGTEYLDPKQAQMIASQFLTLKPHQKSKAAKDSFMTKLGDAWSEIYVNSLLSSPLTHVVNITASVGFQTLRVAEYGIAASINKIPGFGSADGVQFNEVWNMITSFSYASKLGWANGTEAFKTGDVVTTKLDLRKSKAVSKDLLPEGFKDGYMGKMLEYYGTFARMPGRFLVAEDEFMKGIAYHMQLEQLATQKFNKALADGVSEADAEVIRLKTLADPDKETVELAKEGMLETTFQKDLPPGVLKDAQRVLNVPAMKIFVPFYKTIMNIFFESNKRNPGMMAIGALLPGDLGTKIRRDLSGKNGKRVQNLALAKLATGTGMMVTMANMAWGTADFDRDVVITGMAPMDKAERQAFYRKGYQPYSIAVLDKETGQYTSYSYSRMDPISSLLAISADFALMASRPDQYGNENNLSELTDMATAAVLSIYPYMTQQPFLQGIQELGKLFQPGYGDPEGAAKRTVTVLVEKLTNATVGLAVNPTGSFGAYLQRNTDNTIYDTAMTDHQFENGFFANLFKPINDGNVPAPIQAFYKAMNKQMLNSPFFNPELKPKVTLWGQEMKGPEGSWLSPIRIKQSEFNDVDDYLVSIGLGIPMPRGVIQGINMTSDEYYDFIMLMNVDKDQSGFSDMLEKVQAEINKPSFQAKDMEAQINKLRSIVNEARENAKKIFLSENDGFNSRVETLKDRIKHRGKKRK